MTTGLPFRRPVRERYEHLVALGKIERDPAQVAVTARLDALIERLADRRLASKRSPLGWLFAGKGRPQPLKGLYLWGDVGRGKTFLMDLFFAAAPNVRKRRVHFHEFMADVHERVHAFRHRLRRGEAKGNDPIAPVAAAIAGETRLLCFDEFHVTDIADAMILGRLFTKLFQSGVVVVATSNAAPEDLYRSGLNRALFLPFIDLLRQHVDVVRLEARTDFRLERLAGGPVYITPLGPDARARMDEIWYRLTGAPSGAPARLAMKGREIRVPEAAGGVARFSFADLCEAPLGAADYLRLAHAFHTILLDDAPRLDAAARNPARRFINLVDALYENRVKLIMSAAAEPDALLADVDGYEGFAFERTVSRLIEMRSLEYLSRAHGENGFPALAPGEVAADRTDIT